MTDYEGAVPALYEGAVPALADALAKRGYTALTPVQTAVLDPETQTRDLLVSAQTGSGKTVAFGLSMAPTLLQGEDTLPGATLPLALVIAPTRELAMQVKREFEWLYEACNAVVASCVGGMDMRAERTALQHGAHIVVGTPGRLRDHVERGSLDLSNIRAVVLDEADEMLDLGFREDLEYILDAAPTERRTLMFSATVSKDIANLAKRFQKDALRLKTQTEGEQHVDIEYRALAVAPNDRENAIINALRYYDAANAIVFSGTRLGVSHLTSRLANRGFSVVALSGELSQNERTHALQAMRDGRARVCVATDVAARGIDLPNLDLVIHAEIPKTAETLKHRSGRTGRAGRKGVSVVIVPYNWRKRTERLLQNANIQAVWDKPPTAADILERDQQRMLADPTLSAPVTEDEQTFVQNLLAQHSAEQIAAAFLRQCQKNQPAPEELLDAAPDVQTSDAKSKAREAFVDSVWLSLSVGRKHNAEPRWLLPMLCRAGHITKKDIGAIRIQQDHTLVELTSASADKFLAEIGPSRKIEKTITVDRLKGKPDTADAPQTERGDKPFKKRDGKKPYKARTEGPAEPRGDWRPEAQSYTQDAPAMDTAADKPKDKSGYKKDFKKTDRHGDKPGREQDKKVPFWANKTEKSGKPGKFAKSDKPGKFTKSGKPGKFDKTDKGGKPGSRPLKRKKS